MVLATSIAGRQKFQEVISIVSSGGNSTRFDWLKDSNLAQVESPRCCKSVAIRKKRIGNIGRNERLTPK